MNITDVIDQIKSDPLLVSTGRVKYRGVVLNNVQESMFRAALLLCVIEGRLTRSGAMMGSSDPELVEDMVDMGHINKYREAYND